MLSGRRCGGSRGIDRSPLRRRPLVMITGFDFAFAAVGVIDSSLRCPSGARQSPGGEADGDCGTGCVSLRSDLGRRPGIEPSTAHVLRSAVSAARRLTGTRGFRRLVQVTPTVIRANGRGRKPPPLKQRRTKSVQFGSDRREPSMSPGSDRHEPSLSLGCPSVVRRRSRRRLRNGLREPSNHVARHRRLTSSVPQSPLRGD